MKVIECEDFGSDNRRISQWKQGVRAQDISDGSTKELPTTTGGGR